MTAPRPTNDLMMPSEVAALFRVDSKTVARWCKTGRIPTDAQMRTLGGHRRFKRAAIEELARKAQEVQW